MYISDRLFEKKLESILCLLNDVKITRTPDVSTHKATAIDRFLVAPDLAAKLYIVYRRRLFGK